MHDRDRTAAALSSLDPESRALVELSYRRGMTDDEIGDLLQVAPGEVARRRETALGRLSLTAGQLEEYWNPGEGQTVAAARSQGTTGRRVPVAALAVLALIAAVVIVVALASGGSDEGRDGEGGAAQAPTTGEGATTGDAEEKPASSPQPMRRLNGTYGHGTAQLVPSGDRTVLRLDVSDFLRHRGGGYAVWLYNSPEDARRLYATTATSIKRDIPLPRNFDHYRFAEVARAIPDLDSDHSGLSLLRARVSALAER